MKYLTITLLLLAGSARAEIPPWAQPDKGEIIALASVEALIAVDCLQTTRAMNNAKYNLPDMNPLVGASSGRPARAALICGLGGVLTAAAWYVVPPKIRYIVVGVVGVGELLAVTNNFAVGLGFGF